MIPEQPRTADPLSSTAAPEEQRAPSSIEGASCLVVERPTWHARTGTLLWRDTAVLSLAGHAHAERALLDHFERAEWRWVIRWPREVFPECDDIGDTTQSRRHAIHNLNARQVGEVSIYFFSLRGYGTGWCDARWLVAYENVNDRSNSHSHAQS